MKLFGTLFWIIGTISVLSFDDRLKLTDAKFIAVLGFVFFTGALIAFSDKIRSLKAFGGGLEFAEKEINKSTVNGVRKV